MCKELELVKVDVTEKGIEEIITIYKTDTNKKVVNARELFEKLESKRDFSNWIADRIIDCDAIEGEDFTTILLKSNGGRPSKEYILKLDIAKEMSMLERNNQGKKYRRYLINVEKLLKEKSPQLNIENFKSELASIIDIKVEDKLQQLTNYYRPTQKNKIQICNYIKKRLGIETANEQYEIIKEIILILLGAKKWQDLSFETLQGAMDIIDDCIDRIGKEKDQVSFFDEENK